MNSQISQLSDIVNMVREKLGQWDKVQWRYSSRHRRHGYIVVALPSGINLACRCGQTKIIISGYGDITGYEAVMDDTRPANYESCEAIVYETGIVRHKRCGKIVAYIRFAK